jgi:hypothetical protein
VVLICETSATFIAILCREKAHEWLPAGLANDTLGSLIALQLALVTLLRVLDSVTLSLLLRFSSLVRG